MSDYLVIILTLSSAFVSGLGVSVFSAIGDRKKEVVRQKERDHDMLKLELKELEIKLYKVERDLSEWKEKYYATIQELISVRAELEETLIKLSLINYDLIEG